MVSLPSLLRRPLWAKKNHNPLRIFLTTGANPEEIETMIQDLIACLSGKLFR
jgi:hypothetical protein